MTFVGWIDTDTKQYCIHIEESDVIVQKYVNGNKDHGVRKKYTREEFKGFVDSLNIRRNDLPEGISLLLESNQ